MIERILTRVAAGLLVVAASGFVTGVSMTQITDSRENIVLSSRSVLSSVASSLLVRDNLLFTVVGEKVMIYEIVDAGVVRLVGTTGPLNYRVLNIMFVDRVLVLSAERGGEGYTVIVDVSDPAVPKVAYTRIDESPRFVTGRFLVTYSTASLSKIIYYAWSFPVPSEPQIIPLESWPSEVNEFDNASVAGTLLVLHSRYGSDISQGRLTIMDISDIKKPAILSVLAIPPEVDALGTYRSHIYLLDAMSVRDRRSDRIYVISIADTRHPELVGSLQWSAATVNGVRWFRSPSMVFVDEQLITADPDFGLMAIDVHNPSSPRIANDFPNDLRGKALDIDEYGDIYVSSGNAKLLPKDQGIRIVRAKVGVPIQLVSTLYPELPGVPRRLQVFQEHLIAIMTAPSGEQILAVFNATDPQNLVLQGRVSIGPSDVTSLEVGTGLAYVTASGSTTAVDWSDAARPRIVGRWS